MLNLRYRWNCQEEGEECGTRIQEQRSVDKVDTKSF